MGRDQQTHRRATIVSGIVACLLVFATIGCDRVSKRMAVTNLAGAEPRSMLAGTVQLAYAENTGGFLSLGADWPAHARTAVFTVGNGLLLIGLGAFAIQRRRRLWPFVGLSVFVAGGLSNWSDRIAAGHVVDFIIVGYGPLRTGIFNVADAAMMIGLAVFIVAEVSEALRHQTA